LKPRAKRIRSGRGLGDALYLQGVVRHLVNKGDKLRVCCDWPDVFRPVKGGVIMEPFTRIGIHVLAHYSLRKRFADTTQFRDCCLQAGITEKVDLKLDWTPLNHALIDSLKSNKQLIVVQLPRNPMDRKDGFGKELLPDCRVIQKIIDQVKDRARIVQIGAGKALYKFEGIDLDLSNKTSVADLLDVAHASDGFIGYCSFVIPLAESFDKPGLYVWSRAGLKSREPYINSITPRKILEKPCSKAVIDDCQEDEIREAAEILLQQAARNRLFQG
jgi:hypothetical protein